MAESNNKGPVGGLAPTQGQIFQGQVPQGAPPPGYYPPEGGYPPPPGYYPPPPGYYPPPPGGAPHQVNIWNMPLSARKTFIDFASTASVKSRRDLLTPEGLNLHYQLAPLAERVYAVILDYTIIFIANFIIFATPSVIAGTLDEFVMTLSLFSAFVVNNVYFIYFELRWQGRTPGKKVGKLCVINRLGGELSSFSVVSRNITRQLEILFPLALFTGFFGESSIFNIMLPIAWFIFVTLLPLWNKDHLRAGDLLGGTIVVAMPDEELLPDLSGASEDLGEGHYKFTKEQLSIYGSYELHILEEILRKAEKGVTLNSISKVATRISQRINCPLPQRMDYKGTILFLTDFYSSQRAHLEEAKLYGRHKANQYTPMLSYQMPPGPQPKAPRG